MSPAVKIKAASIKEHNVDNILRRFLFFSLKTGYVNIIFILYVEWKFIAVIRFPPLCGGGGGGKKIVMVVVVVVMAARY